MRRKKMAPLAALAALALVAAGCSTDDIDDDPGADPGINDTDTDDNGDDDDDNGDDDTNGTDDDDDNGDDNGAGDDEWFVQADYDAQNEWRGATFEGDPSQPHLQYIDLGEMTDTSEWATDEAMKVCFANASISNPWRQTGWITMNQQLEALQDAGVISEMETRDAEDDDDRQIADIDYFISEGDCDAFIISPNSTAALTDAVDAACDTGKPVVVFDRGVNTDCATTFIHPIGGYAWGIDTAEFLIEHLEPGDEVIALRILPGVDVLEHRWTAAERLFDEAGIEVTDHFTGADPETIKSLVTDALTTGEVHGIWMDAGDGAEAAIEAFEDMGVDYPVITGEDEMSFLRKWEETGLTGLAPVYSNFQWRTPLLAVEMIAAGEEVPAHWVLPQEPITEADRGEFLEANDGMPDGHYAKFGGEDLPGYPEAWQNR